ncbi:MAG: glutamine synthetase [Gammaproteobacteria bacterium]|nr:MAG: glutamine synthetase [Gammaproteobacteria bacterium]
MNGDDKAIADWLKQNNISQVECLVPDITGNARGKFVPVEQYLKQGELRMPESLLIQSVTGEYSNDHWDFVEPTDGDMILQPDHATIRVVPWARKPTAQLIHSCYTMDGDPHPLSSRSVLQRILDLYGADGLKPVVAPEVEFYLLARNTDFDCELQPPVGRSGRVQTSHSSCSIDSVLEFDAFIDDLYANARAQQLDIETLIYESGAAQMEINFLHGDAMSLADQVFTFKRTVRETAHKHGIYATFMAKPMEKEPGSAMHIHQSIVRADSGDNIFVDEKGEHNSALMSYIAGLQRYTPELIGLYAPNVNSYRRLAPDISAPINMDWGYDNRTTAFRVPHSVAAATRVENRFPGADVNPYLAFAATLASGYLGMKKQLQPSKPQLGITQERSIDLARTLEEGLRQLQSSPEVREVFGELFLRAYTAVKLNESEQFSQVVSAWEREHLLLQV